MYKSIPMDAIKMTSTAKNVDKAMLLATDQGQKKHLGYKLPI